MNPSRLGRRSQRTSLAATLTLVIPCTTAVAAIVLLAADATAAPPSGGRKPGAGAREKPTGSNKPKAKPKPAEKEKPAAKQTPALPALKKTIGVDDPGLVSDLRFAADGAELVSVGKNGSRRLSVETGKGEQHRPPTSDVSTHEALSSDAETAVLIERRSLRVVSTRTGQIVRQFALPEGAAGPDTLCTIAPDGSVASVGPSEDKTLLVELKSGNVIRQFQPADSPVVYSDDGRLAALRVPLNPEKTRLAWKIVETKSGNTVASIPLTGVLAFAPSGQRLIGLEMNASRITRPGPKGGTMTSESESSGIGIWDLKGKQTTRWETGEHSFSTAPHAYRALGGTLARSVQWLPDERLALQLTVTKGRTDGIVVWDVGRRRAVALEPVPRERFVGAWALSPDGRRLAVAWHTSAGRVGGRTVGPIGLNDPLGATRVGGEIVGGDGKIDVYDLQSVIDQLPKPKGK